MKHIRLIAFSIVLAAVSFTGCGPKSTFVHDRAPGSPMPWLGTAFDDGSDKFQFAIISDLNGGERAGIFDVAVEQLNLLRPELIMSVGDLVEGASSNADSIAMEYKRFDERAGKAKAPLVHVGGNHDLTDPVMRNVWKERYGAHYYHFIYKNVLFLVLDTEDHTDARRKEIHEARQAAIKMMDGPTSEKADTMAYFKMPERVTGNIGKEQAAYFTEVIAKNPGVTWTLLFMHKPVWRREGEGSLEPLEKALTGKSYTVFNGHFHSYSHTTKNNADYMMLGTTGGHQGEKDPNSFDHVTLVTMTGEGPSVANLRLDGILTKFGKLPLNGDSLCFQASHCGQAH